MCPIKVGDGNPLRRWRVSVEVEAPPSVVLNRVLRERHLWDVDLLQWKVCETLDKQTEVFQYALSYMPPHPSRDFLVLRLVEILSRMKITFSGRLCQTFSCYFKVVEDRLAQGCLLLGFCVYKD